MVVPRLNWRGLFGKGTDIYGYATTAEIEWPGFQTTASHSRSPTHLPTKAYYGTLLEGQRDAGRQMYMRNRPVSTRVMASAAARARRGADHEHPTVDSSVAPWPGTRDGFARRSLGMTDWWMRTPIIRIAPQPSDPS